MEAQLHNFHNHFFSLCDKTHQKSLPCPSRLGRSSMLHYNMSMCLSSTILFLLSCPFCKILDSYTQKLDLLSVVFFVTIKLLQYKPRPSVQKHFACSIWMTIPVLHVFVLNCLKKIFRSLLNILFFYIRIAKHFLCLFGMNSQFSCS